MGDNPKTIAAVEKGDVIGEMSMFDDRPHMATAKPQVFLGLHMNFRHHNHGDWRGRVWWSRWSNYAGGNKSEFIAGNP